MMQIDSKYPPVRGLVEIVNQFQKPNMVVAEIGTYDGSTSCAIAPLIKQMNGTFIAVDWFHGSINVEPDDIRFSKSQHSQLLNRFKKNIEIVGCSDITKIYDMDSIEASKIIEDKSLDICFIDADHRYEAVKKDILAYMPKIKPGGILCGHDLELHSINKFNTFSQEDLTQDYIHNCHPGVIQAIGEIIGFKYITPYSDHVWAVEIV